MSRSDDAIEIEGVRLSSPDRVLWEEQGITKRALAEYYRAVARWMLPHVEDRPLTLIRCPQGPEKHCFVQRRVGEGFPDFIHRVAVEVDDEKGEAVHVAVDSLPGIVYLAQIGVLEIHVWGARRDRLRRPDRMIFDLDPDTGIPFSAVIEAALEVRARLKGLGLESFVKTTGGKGLHVVVPIARSATWEQVHGFTRALAEEMATRNPRKYLAEASKSERTGRIYVDYVRNGYSATSVAPYSTRARPGAPVSTPLTWAELEKGVTPGDYNVLTVPERLRRLRQDPWKGFAATKQSLTKAVRAGLGVA